MQMMKPQGRGMISQPHLMDSDKLASPGLKSGRDEPMSDEQLKSLASAVEKNVPKNLRRQYLSLVAAGRQLMLSKQMEREAQTLFSRIQSPQQLPGVVAHGIVKVISLLVKPAGKSFSIPAANLAAITLMEVGLRYASSATNIPITDTMVNHTTVAIVQGLMQLFKITPDQTKAAFDYAKAHGPAKPGEQPAEEEAPEEEPSAPTAPPMAA